MPYVSQRSYGLYEYMFTLVMTSIETRFCAAMVVFMLGMVISLSVKMRARYTYVNDEVASMLSVMF